MFKRFCLALSATTVAAFTVSVGHAQTTPAPAPPPLVSAWHAQFSKDWSPPRTPWGDPDLQGNYTATDEMGTPMERPAEFEGRSLSDITPAELKAMDDRHNARAAAEGTGGGAVPTGWYEGEYAKRSRAWHVIDPPDGKLPPLTPAAAKVAANAPPNIGGQRLDQASSRTAKGTNLATYLDWSLSDRCITRNSPPESMLPNRLGAQVHIVQTPEYVTMRFEELRTTRIIPIKGRGGERPLIPSVLRPYNGDAMAWFEGNTLVVDTVYHDKDVDVMDSPAGTARTIERFTRRTRPAGIEYTATIINPEWWVRPWTFQQRLTEDDRAGLIFEYTCHEHNHSLVNALSGARYEERREAERKARAEERAKEAGQSAQPRR